MRFALDLVFLDRSLRAVSLRRAVPPGRVAFERRRPGGARAAGGGRVRAGRRPDSAAAGPSPPRRWSSARTTRRRWSCSATTSRPTASAPCRRPRPSDALRLCHYKQPDLLLLDLRLPDAPGLDVLREIRASEGAIGRYDPALPVIVLSGRGTADGPRPRASPRAPTTTWSSRSTIRSSTARIRAVLRRRDPRRDGPRRVGEIFIDPSRRQVRVGDRPVRLANKEFSLLRALAGRADARVHQGGAASRRLGLSLHGPRRGRSTRTPAGCGASSTPRTGAT